MKIGILGDTHGNTATVFNMLDRFKANGISNIVQVGDFGFWPGNPGMTFLREVNTHLSKNEQTLYVVPGNHEDYRFINSLHVHEDGWMRARENILVAPRGFRWEWEGVSFVALGGAPSVDRAWRRDFQRRNGHPVWWPEEDITREDMDKTISGGEADVMIAHDAPYGVPAVERGIAGNPLGFESEDIAYADVGRQKMREVVEHVKPKIFFHGHYHWKVDDVLELEDSSVTHIKGMAADGAPMSVGILTLPDLTFQWGLQR